MSEFGPGNDGPTLAERQAYISEWLAVHGPEVDALSSRAEADEALRQQLIGLSEEMSRLEGFQPRKRGQRFNITREE